MAAGATEDRCGPYKDSRALGTLMRRLEHRIASRTVCARPGSHRTTTSRRSFAAASPATLGAGSGSGHFFDLAATALSTDAKNCGGLDGATWIRRQMPHGPPPTVPRQPLPATCTVPCGGADTSLPVALISRISPSCRRLLPTRAPSRRTLGSRAHRQASGVAAWCRRAGPPGTLPPARVPFLSTRS